MYTYYRIKPGSPAHARMQGIHEKCHQAAEARRLLVLELGGERCFGKENGFTIKFGGIGGIEFPERPSHWRNAGNYPNFYYPRRDRVAVKEVLTRIEALPVVTIEEYNRTLCYDAFDVGRHYYNSFGYTFSDGVFYVEMALNNDYKMVEGMEEITASAWQAVQEPKPAPSDEPIES